VTLPIHILYDKYDKSAPTAIGGAGFAPSSSKNTSGGITMTKLFGAAGAALLCSLALFAAPAKADVDGSCAGKKMIFFPGGGEGDTFASIVYRGARLAQKQTGCHVDYVWSDWNPEKMVAQFKEAIARKPTAISIMGHPGEAALAKLIDEARAAGIIVTTANVDLPESEAQYKANGFG
jgi:simple sugar transport system substrate-binding protein